MFFGKVGKVGWWFCLFVFCGGNSTIFWNFHPENWGKWIQFEEYFFRWVGSTTNQFVFCVFLLLLEIMSYMFGLFYWFYFAVSIPMEIELQNVMGAKECNVRVGFTPPTQDSSHHQDYSTCGGIPT